MSIFNHFQNLNLSQDQEAALTKLEAFLASQVQVFMLKGYAGSGKTTILKGLVEYLKAVEKDFALMAPTARAARVISEKTDQNAYTIHKSIYCFEDMIEVEDKEILVYYFMIRSNEDVAGKVFIVDEVSMITNAHSENEFFRCGSGHVLSDLIAFTQITNPKVNSKIIFVGDPCQLLPVGDNSSKAFDHNYLIENFNVSIDEVEMKEVKRHASESGILKIASKFRKSITANFYNEFSLRSNETDVLILSFNNFLDTWLVAPGKKIIIASKNRTCRNLNLMIRERLYGNADLLVQKGDIVISCRNNYCKDVFNGQFAVVNEVSESCISRTIGLKGKKPVELIWRNIELIFPDEDGRDKIVNGKILENFLYGDNELQQDERQALYVDFVTRHNGLSTKSEEFKQAIVQDEFFNCLFIKFGYAVTCHKAQGGEWDNVFTVWDHDNQKNFNCYNDKQLKQSKDNETFFRWAYTAVTRASKKLYAMNPPFFNSYSQISFIDEAVLKSLNELSGANEVLEEISIDDDILLDLEKFDLLNQPVFLQDYFIRVRESIKKRFFNIISWKIKNMEIFISFEREKETAGVKTWVNKDNVFNGKFLKVPSLTNSDVFLSEIEILLKNLPIVSVKRDTVDTVLNKIEFNLEQEEKFPFTKSLFNDLSITLAEKKIKIQDIVYLQYKDRYTFIRNQETAMIDFEYNNNGFFGRVLPIQKQCNSKSLIFDIKSAIQKIKHEEYAG